MSDFQLTEIQREQLAQISTATLTSILIKRGIRRSFMLDVYPLAPHLHLAGTAFTLRYIPSRQDLTDRRYDNETNVQRIAMESIGEGQVLVIDARGNTDVGTMGDILATRIQQRGAAGIVTDGGLRDTPALAEMNFPIFLGGAAAPPSHLVHHPVDINQPIGCGNVAVIPGDSDRRRWRRGCGCAATAGCRSNSGGVGTGTAGSLGSNQDSGRPIHQGTVSTR